MKERVIRVFISSTFKDMKAERDELVKFVFPQLKKICTERQVIWSEVDLRWGITDEQKAEGQVLPICLQEIKRCRPYFIGILGERYGWIPGDIEPKVLEQEPWVKENPKKSVTELEILQGVLNNPDMADHAFFYFRSKQYVESLLASERDDYMESPSPEEIADYGLATATTLAQERKAKLEHLKNRIRQSGFPVRENYSDPKSFGDMVMKDFIELIDSLFPENAIPDEFDREVHIHDSYALSRCGCYIGGEYYFERLNQHILSTDPPLVITGESGTGKSSLIANWSTRFIADNPSWKIFRHFIGASPLSADPVEMLKRIIKELNRDAGIQMDIPKQVREIMDTFDRSLKAAAGKGKFILIIDALNNLEDKENAQGLGWLPESVPQNIRILVSTLPGRCFDLLEKRGWPVLKINPFNPDDKKLFISTYLQQYSKNLPKEITDYIIVAPQTTNPLYLQTLIEELRIYGDHQTLVRKCEYYLQAQTLVELFKKLLERYEEDYEIDRAGLIMDTLCTIWASRRGLSETELLEIASIDNTAILRRQWSDFFIPAEHLFIMSAGKLNFSFDYFRQAVVERYLSREYLQKKLHRNIAEYYLKNAQFSITDTETGKPITDPEKIDLAIKMIWLYFPEDILREIAWQFFKAEEWNRLYSLLSNPYFNMTMDAIDSYETKIYWSAIKENSENSFLTAFQNFGKIAEEYGLSVLGAISTQAADLGHSTLSLQIQQLLIKERKSGSDQRSFTERIQMAWNHHHQGQTKLALQEMEIVESEARTAGDAPSVHLAIIDKAQMIHFLGNFEKAQTIFIEAEHLCREAGNRYQLKNALCAMGTNMNRLGKYDEALEKLNEANLLAEEYNDTSIRHQVLGELSNNAMMRREYEKAIFYIEQKEEICKTIGNPKSLAVAYNSHAAILSKQGNEREAIRYLKLAEKKFVEACHPQGIASAKMNQGVLLMKLHLYKEAEPLFRETVKRFGEIGYEINREKTNEYLATVLNNLNHCDEALMIINTLIKTHIQSGNSEDLNTCAILKLAILGNLERFEELGRFHVELRQEIQSSGMVSLIKGLSLFFSFETAITGMKEQHEKEVEARTENLQLNVAISLVQQAWVVIMLDIKMYHWLAKATDEIEMFGKQPDYTEFLRVSYYYKGWLLYQENRLDESYGMMVKAFNSSYDANDGPNFSWAAHGLSQIYMKMGNLQEAQKYAELSIMGFEQCKLNIGLKIAYQSLQEIKDKMESEGPDEDHSKKIHEKATESEIRQSGLNDEDEKFWQGLFTLSRFVPEVENLRDIDLLSKQNILRVIYLVIQKGIGDQTKEAIHVLTSHLNTIHRIQDISPVFGLSGWMLFSQGHKEKAMKVFREMEGICSGINYQRGIAAAYRNQGLVFEQMNNLKEALKLLEKSTQIFEEDKDKVSLQINYKEQFSILKKTGQFEKAMAMSAKREKVCIESGDKKNQADTYNDHGCLLTDLGMISESVAIHREAFKIHQSIDDKNGLQLVLGNLANGLRDLKQYEEAIGLLEKKEAICREIDNKEELAATFGYRAIILMYQGSFNESVSFFEKEENICRKIGAQFRLQVSIGNKASSLMQLNREEEAFLLFKEKEAICRRMNITYGLVVALMNLSIYYINKGKYRDSISHAEEGLELATRAGYKKYIGKFQEIIEDSKRMSSQSVSPPIRGPVETTHSNLKSSILATDIRPATTESKPPMDYEKMLSTLVNQENVIGGKTNNQQEYQENICEQAYTLSKLGRYKDALQKYEFAAEICARNGFFESYVDCLLSQAELMIEHLDTPKRAKNLLEEAILLAHEHNFAQLEKEARKMTKEVS